MAYHILSMGLPHIGTSPGIPSSKGYTASYDMGSMVAWGKSGFWSQAHVLCDYRGTTEARMGGNLDLTFVTSRLTPSPMLDLGRKFLTLLTTYIGRITSCTASAILLHPRTTSPDTPMVSRLRSTIKWDSLMLIKPAT